MTGAQPHRELRASTVEYKPWNDSLTWGGKAVVCPLAPHLSVGDIRGH